MFPAANLRNGSAIPAIRAPRCRRQQRTRWAWRPLWLMTVVHRQMRSPISSVCLSVQQLGGSLSCHRRSGSDRCTDDTAEPLSAPFPSSWPPRREHAPLDRRKSIILWCRPAADVSIGLTAPGNRFCVPLFTVIQGRCVRQASVWGQSGRRLKRYSYLRTTARRRRATRGRR